MAFWQESLLVLAVLWSLQAAGTWLQMRHYGAVMRRITQSWPDGCVGASAARSMLGRGVIAIVVASPDAAIRQIFVMEGRSVFAKFRELSVVAGAGLGTIADAAVLADGPKARRTAVAAAVAQIERRVRATVSEPAEAAIA